MKYKSLLPLILCFSLAVCVQPSPAPTPEPPAEAPSITVAPIEGEAVSPNGKWELVQEGGNDGITSGGRAHPGIYVPGGGLDQLDGRKQL